MDVREVTLLDVAHYWFNMMAHVIMYTIMIPSSPDKKSTLATIEYAN